MTPKLLAQHSLNTSQYIRVQKHTSHVNRVETALPPLHPGDSPAESQGRPSSLEYQVGTWFAPSGHLLSFCQQYLRNPELVQFAYTPDSIWRNRDIFLQGRDAIVEFLRNKWAKEGDYRLRKELFAFTDNKVRYLLHSTSVVLREKGGLD